MPTLSKLSLEKLQTCDKRLQKLITEVAKTYDCTVTCGHRNETDQTEAFRSGASKLRFPNSKHNSFPSKAVDVVPYPVDWQDTNRFYHFAGFVLAKAEQLDIKIRWGGDWDGDLNFREEKFRDLPHLELVD